METDGARALLRRLGRFLDGFSGCFTRRPQAAAASQYLDGLFKDSERKSMQAMHGRLSDPVSYHALQHFISSRTRRGTPSGSGGTVPPHENWTAR